MTPIDTNQPMTIFPQPIGVKNIVVSVLIALLGLTGPWMAVVEGITVLAFVTFWLMPLGVWMLWVFRKRRREGNKDAALTLSPQGLHLMTGTTGVIPWQDVKSLRGFSVRGNTALTINVDEDAFKRLNKTKFFDKSRKFDAALGVHSLAFFQQQLELPIPVVADLLHQYSIAHGGPALQPDP